MGIGNQTMQLFMRAACGLWLAFACVSGAVSPVAAQTSDPVVVVELYTSQGCSSCPPADALLAELAELDHVVPLALHVDYWDYLGWKDDFANPRFTERQKAYARAAGSRMIYTPQIIVAGEQRIEGNQPADVIAAVGAHLAKAAPIRLEVQRHGGGLRITAEMADAPAEPLRVQLVRYRPEETVTIRGGENAGRTITYRNIVTEWQPLGDWPGHSPLVMDAPARGDDPAIVILQAPGPAAILAAARVE